MSTTIAKQQKFFTIYLDAHAYMGDHWIKGTHADRHATLEEHLTEYLQDGWRITSVAGFGGGEGISVRGWFAVVLER